MKFAHANQQPSITLRRSIHAFFLLSLIAASGCNISTPEPRTTSRLRVETEHMTLDVRTQVPADERIKGVLASLRRGIEILARDVRKKPKSQWFFQPNIFFWGRCNHQ